MATRQKSRSAAPLDAERQLAELEAALEAVEPRRRRRWLPGLAIVSMLMGGILFFTPGRTDRTDLDTNAGTPTAVESPSTVVIGGDSTAGLESTDTTIAAASSATIEVSPDHNAQISSVELDEPTEESTTEAAPEPAPAPAPAAAAATGTPAIWRYYGNPWTMRSLADVGLDGERVSIRITAKSTGVMNGFRTYYKAAIGSQSAGSNSYSNGTGGTIKVELWPDNGSGFPDESGRPLAEVPPWAPGLRGGRPVGSQHDTFFRFSAWTSPPTIQAGEVYHVVFENLDSNPNANFLSINNGYEVEGARERGPFGPQVADWGILRDTGSWQEWTTRGSADNGRYDPIFVAEMADGSSWGNGYMEMADDGSSMQRYRAVTGSSWVRQVFTPREDHVVDAVALHVFGDAAGMEVQLSDGSGTLGTWPLSFSASGNNTGQWQTRGFDPLTLRAGTTYYLSVRKASGSGTTSISMIRDGSAGGLTTKFPGGATWSDGQAQISTNSGGSWSNLRPADRADVAGLVFRTAG
ncbi:MAG: choice-of-anchor R domain-containing protein [Actinomycetota bacterium]